MIKTVTLNGGLLRTYSDAGRRIQQVGTDEIYDEAIDLATSGYTYTETDEYIDVSPEEIINIIAGGGDNGNT